METKSIGFWNSKKEKFRDLFPEISQDDLIFNEGKQNTTIEKLEYKLGLTKKELRNIINEQ